MCRRSGRTTLKANLPAFWLNPCSRGILSGDLLISQVRIEEQSVLLNPRPIGAGLGWNFDMRRALPAAAHEAASPWPEAATKGRVGRSSRFSQSGNGRTRHGRAAHHLRSGATKRFCTVCRFFLLVMEATLRSGRGGLQSPMMLEEMASHLTVRQHVISVRSA